MWYHEPGFLAEFALSLAEGLGMTTFVVVRKAMIHTWLAWQREPGRPMGLAITKRFLDPEAPSAMEFVAWVRRLFDLPT